MAKNSSFSSDQKDIRTLYIDERTQRKIHEHLNNEADIITEQDIANVATGVVMENKMIHVVDAKDIIEDRIEDIDESSDKELEEKKIKNNDDTDIDTSWNILGS